MKTALATCAALVAVCAAACSGQKVDLGGAGQGALQADATSAGEGSNAGATSCVAASETCGYTGPCSDGSGYLADTPSWCSAAAGAATSFASASEVAAALVGLWTNCNGSTFVNAIDPSAGGIELTSDGRFYSLGYPIPYRDQSLGRLTAEGTFEVVSAAGTLGPGAFELRLTASDGGIHTAQVVVYGSPARMRLFVPGAEDYVHPLTKAYEAHVCGPGFGPAYTPTDPADLLAHMQGRWVRCDNHIWGASLTDLPFLGIDIPGDGTWHYLHEDETGAIVPSSDPTQSGTITADPLYGPLAFDLTPNGPAGGSIVFTPLLDQCGAMTEGGGPDGGIQGPSSFEFRRLQ